ncbi:MAG: YbfB/YjiJ family MFS transporter [Desulfomicrobium escambiense]|nr:YbfB/YjiJ family MFS transporter [Desulfomicrobium escambiense]
MLVFFFQTLSYFLIALALPGAALTLSIVFFGIVAWSIPSIMAAAVGDYMGPQGATAAFGFITFIFGIGQIIGPAVAGVLAEKSGSFSASFFMAAAAGALAIILSAFLKRPTMLQ